MEQSTNLGTDVLELLQPELMSEDELKQILVSRCYTKDLSNCTKNELVDIFRKIALPLPQREYSGTSWREKILSQKQQRTTKKRLSITIDTNSSFKQEPERKVPRLSNDTTTTSPQERLKPPPDLINYNRKVIKLSQTSSKTNKSDLDKIVIKSKPREKHEENPAAAKDQKQDVKTAEEVNGKQTSVVKSENIVKRKPVSVEGEKSKDGVKEETSPKKKRQKIVISW